MVGRKFKGFSVRMIVTLCLLILFPLVSRADVTFTIGDGSGSPGSTNNSVTVSLANPDNKVGGLQVDICDVEDYLTCTGCETTVRTTMFDCGFNEQENGCVSVILYSTGEDPEGNPSVIEVGSGPIFVLKYDVSTGAPPGECKALTPEEPSVVDELGYDIETAALVSGQFCFTQTVSTTTTTGPIITTTTTTASSSTTTIPSSCEVSVSPLAVTLQSGTTVQFTAKTSCGEGTYTWQIVPESTIGSTIDQDGLFTAGDNTTETDIEETVRVTDTAHGNESATATVTIQVKEDPLPECEVTINPSSATVYSGDTLTLEAHTSGVDCEPGNYEWSISSDIGSMIEDGAYTAGNNDTGSQVTDIITVVDHANFDITGATSIYVEGEGTDNRADIIPCTLLGCRWIPLPYVLLAWGKDAHFDLSSTISFEPGDDISELFQVGCGKIFLALVLLGADAQEGPVTVTISTGEEVVTGEIKILSLFPLAEGLLR